ncbi:hypothetical protein FQN49_004863, partial [Arthroderma sp. PD_2]
KGLYPESSVNDQQNLPVVTRGPMAGTAYPVPPPLPHYGRPAASHPHGYSPAPYNWPTPGMNGPPPHAQPSYTGSYLPPLAGASGHPQYQYAQHPHLPPSQAGYPPQYERPHPADAQAPSAHGSSSHNASSRGYVYYPTSRSPGHPQAGHMGPAENIYQPGGKMDPRLSMSSSDSRSPREAMNSLQHTPVKSPGLSHINRSPQSGIQNGHGHDGSPGSSATAVPSINALMNGPPLNENPNMPGYHQGAAPAPGAVGEGPKDIPDGKIHFGEDMRALRQLDRVFTT